MGGRKTGEGGASGGGSLCWGEGHLVMALLYREALTSMKIVKKKVFFDERWSHNRNVTSMDWSIHVSNSSTWSPPV